MSKTVAKKTDLKLQGAATNAEIEAPYTGVYYIAAGAYEDYTGDYTLGIMELL